ncbi:uncharacterized protein LOC110854710 [Folsomia candida]|uniref:uncharacterized protein LOC110854710 n=1 Tax=Folsomia candida TaxID=158441 RepID=UPI0016050F7A|nr:uncharacterized protein LOC110854710 [Folsomia candida]
MRDAENWPHLKISFPFLRFLEDGQENWKAKYAADLKWFLKQKRGHYVKTLALNGYIHSDQDYLMYLDTVSEFKDTLEEFLTIKTVDHNGPEQQYSQRDLFFPVLKKFSLRIFNHMNEPIVPVTTSWMKTWADAITRVKSISTLGHGFLGSRIAVAMQTTGTLGYGNLRQIMLTCKPTDGINFLMGMNPQLKSLTLTLPLEPQHLPEFENLLKKFAPSLNLLRFRVDTNGLEEKSRFVLNLPCFPKLINKFKKIKLRREALLQTRNKPSHQHPRLAVAPFIFLYLGGVTTILFFVILSCIIQNDL